MEEPKRLGYGLGKMGFWDSGIQGALKDMRSRVKNWKLDVPQNVMLRVTMGSSNSIARHLPKRVENICAHGILCLRAHSSFIYNSPNLETSHMSIN